MKIGDRVRYKASFLRSIGAYTGDLPHARGVVVGLQKLGDNVLVEIEWGNENIPRKVLAPNLEKIR